MIHSHTDAIFCRRGDRRAEHLGMRLLRRLTVSEAVNTGEDHAGNSIRGTSEHSWNLHSNERCVSGLPHNRPNSIRFGLNWN